MNKSFWKGKRVIITGDTGFKGSWLAIILKTYGAIVQGISSSKYDNNIDFFNNLELHKISNTIDCDVRDSIGLNKIFDSFKPDIIFHMAAQPLVRMSYQDPVNTFEINIMGTMSILEAIRKSPSVKSAVIVTTDKCYENKEWAWGYRENDPLGGHDPYSSSKACAELLTQSYQKSFFNDLLQSPGVSTVRAGNVIGGGDFSHDRLIPDLYRAIQNHSKLTLRNPLATRPWQHVFEPLSGYMRVAQNLFEKGAQDNDIWNFGPNISDIRTVQEIVDLFSLTWGVKNIYKYDAADQPHEAKSLSLDISKARFKLGWSPKWNLENAINITATWYKAHYNNENLMKLSSQQIEEFF